MIKINAEKIKEILNNQNLSKCLSAFGGKYNNIFLKSALVLAIIDLALIAAILTQVNGLVKDIFELQSRQTEVEGMRERLKKAEEIKMPEVEAEKKEEIKDSLTVDSETGWQVYRNDELNLEFKFPQDYVVATGKELENFDNGKLRGISVTNELEKNRVMNLLAISKDYGIGVGEGCCFYYADDPINLNLSDAELLEILNNNFAKNIENVIFDVKRYNLSGREAVRFFKTDAYGSIWAHDAILLPYNVSGFTNILITSPSIVTVPSKGGESEEQRKQTIQTIINSIRNSEYLKDENVAKEYMIFKQILSTLKFK